MIKDHIDHANRYASVHPLFSAAFKWLADPANLKLPDGRIELDGDQLIAMPQHYQTHGFDNTFEAHQRYIDIQYIVSGTERIDVGDIEAMTIISPYESAKDVAFFKGKGSSLIVNAGEFVILWPREGHAPGCHPAETPASVHKIVLKIALSPR